MTIRILVEEWLGCRAARVASCEKGIARWRADRAGDESVVEEHALASHAIQVGRPDVSAIRTDGPLVLVVRETMMFGRSANRLDKPGERKSSRRLSLFE